MVGSICAREPHDRALLQASTTLINLWGGEKINPWGMERINASRLNTCRNFLGNSCDMKHVLYAS